MKKKINYAQMFTLRKDGRYQGYWKDRDGKRHTICDKDPEKLYNRILERESYIPTFADVSSAWADEHYKTLRAGTISSYEPIRRMLASEFQSTPITDMTAADIDRILQAEKANGMSYKHAATVKLVFKGIFNYAIKQKYIQYNPAIAVSVPRGLTRTIREAPCEDTCETIKRCVGLKYGLIPYFIYYTGFRTEELVALQWGDIDFEHKIIRCQKAADMHCTPPKIAPTKTSAGVREVPLLDDLKKYLIRPDGAKDEDFVFCDENGDMLTQAGYRSRWLTWCRAAGFAEYKIVVRYRRKDGKPYNSKTWVPTLTSHQLRHAYCTVLYEAGIDELTAMELMGHSDYETTRRIYTHLRQKKRDGVAEKLNGMF